VGGGGFVQHEAPLPLHRPARQQRFAPQFLGIGQLEFVKHPAHGDVRRLVDGDAHGAILVVFADIDNGVGKIGILQARHGKQELVFEIDTVFFSHDPSPVNA